MTNRSEVHVGPGGTFRPKGDHVSTPADIAALFETLSSTQATSITIHFHGGLVSEAKGVEVAEMMAPVYAAADSYPVAFVWETGLVETFRDNLLKIHETKLFQKLLVWVAKRVAQRFGGLNAKGVGEPITNAEIAAELKKLKPFADYDDAEPAKGAAQRGDIGVTEDDLDVVLEELEAEFEEDIDADDEIEALIKEREGQSPADASEKGLWSSLKFAKQLAKIAYRVIKRHLRDRDHGLHCTVVEEVLREYYLADLGAWVWGNMKSKADSMWNDNTGLSGEELHVGRTFLDALHAHQQANPNFTVNLVGHSAGTIVICHMLRTIAAHYPGLTIDDVHFLAAAARTDLAVAEVARHNDRYKRFRFFTMADQFEQDDVLFPYAYSRSLLYFISGVLEPDEVDIPIAGMMRHASKQPPFDTGVAREWADFISADNRAVYSDTTEIDPTAPPGRRCTARKHGDFDNDVAMQQSLTHILSD